MFDKIKIGNKAKAAQKFTPVHPDPSIGKKHGISLMLHGKHSSHYQNAMALALRKRKGRDLEVDEMIEQSAQIIVDCCTGWEGVEDKDGKAEAFNSDKLFQILTDNDYRWLRIQAESFQLKDDNFF